MSDYLELFKTKTFVFNTLGMAAVTFATGAYAAWGSAFYQRIHGLTPAEAGQQHRPACWSEPACWESCWACFCPTSCTSSPSGPTCCSRRWPSCARPRWAYSASWTTTRIRRWAYLFGRVGLALDGAGPVQYRDGQRRCPQPPGGRLCGLYLLHSFAGRHQFADPSGMDLRAFRRAERDGLAARADSLHRSAQRPWNLRWASRT